MKKSRLRLQAAALAFILLPAASGVLAVHASATCERFVRTYVTTPVRNRVSRQTADAWAKWRIGHPNWKPNPNLHRPKYVMTQDEAVKKVDFACSVPTEPTDIDLLLEPANLELPPPIVDLTPMQASQITFPDEIPPEVAEVTNNDLWPPLAPFVPPVLGGTPGTPQVPAVPGVPVGGAVPEPASFILFGSAALLGLLFVGKNRKGNQTDI
jgi:hypothetical protein